MGNIHSHIQKIIDNSRNFIGNNFLLQVRQYKNLNFYITFKFHKDISHYTIEESNNLTTIDVVLIITILLSEL